MRDVERLLTAALVEIAAVDPAHPDARHASRAYFAELDRRSDRGFDPARGDPPSRTSCGRPPACSLSPTCGRAGRLRRAQASRRRAGRVKRMWVAASARGLGLGRRLLGELEARARASGAPVARLETNRHLVEAIALYRSAGYREVPPFNDEPFADHWFEKRLR